MTASMVVLCAAAFLAVIVVLMQRDDAEATSAFEDTVGVAKPTAPKEPDGLTAARRLVGNAGTAGGLHFRVRPALVELTEARLRRHHGIDLSHLRAAEVVGEELWVIVRPDAPAPHDRMAPGMSIATFSAALDRLERL